MSAPWSQRWERRWYAGPSTPLSPLRWASGAFGAATAVRNALYDRGVLPATPVHGARVVSVGNLTVGGSGKTPTVIYLANRWAHRKIAVLSRGYGRAGRGQALALPGARADAASLGDEPALIARRCPRAAVLVGADRVALARRARAELKSELLLLDDGLQHRRLERDVNIVTVDESVGFGNGELLPAGPLREGLAGLRRADLIWLYVSDAPFGPLPEWPAPVVRARLRPAAWLTATSEEPLEAVRGRKVLALAGIARPERFVRTLESLGAVVESQRLFADHHRFSAAELEEISHAATRAGALVCTTEKDAVRLPGGFSHWALKVDVEVLSGLDLVDRVVAGAPEASA